MNTEIIIGQHSVMEALQNPDRKKYRLVGTRDSLALVLTNQIKGSIDKQIIVETDIHQVQELAKKAITAKGFEFHRIPSNLFLEVSAKEIKEQAWLTEQLEGGKPFRILALDQVTDVMNGAAIMRTAAFYGVDLLILSMKGSFGLSPSFYRNASGAVEHMEILKTSNLSKTINTLRDLGVECFGLSETGEIFSERHRKIGNQVAIVMGSEDKGLSHAVERCIENLVKLVPVKDFQTLNVSAASAISLEKFFGS